MDVSRLVMLVRITFHVAHFYDFQFHSADNTCACVCVCADMGECVSRRFVQAGDSELNLTDYEAGPRRMYA